MQAPIYVPHDAAKHESDHLDAVNRNWIHLKRNELSPIVHPGLSFITPLKTKPVCDAASRVAAPTVSGLRISENTLYDREVSWSNLDCDEDIRLSESDCEYSEENAGCRNDYDGRLRVFEIQDVLVLIWCMATFGMKCSLGSPKNPFKQVLNSV
ncbi:hypothetical protein TNCV_1151061 [Trichonephila clavipes]|nr:hypothetical protein TNCV_1151061 [Trichonephila clavipes]